MVLGKASAPAGVIYVTGAPGSGKSTLVSALVEMFANVRAFSYGARMVTHLRGRGGVAPMDQCELRHGTDFFVSMDDIRIVDQEMVNWVAEKGSDHLLLIDTHQVTLEATGLRLVPFSPSNLAALGVTKVWFLAASDSVTIERISTDPKGRVVPNIFQAQLHTTTQMAVAVQYAVSKGIEMRVIDANESKSVVLRNAISDLFGQKPNSRSS